MPAEVIDMTNEVETAVAACKVTVSSPAMLLREVVGPEEKNPIGNVKVIRAPEGSGANVVNFSAIGTGVLF